MGKLLNPPRIYQACILLMLAVFWLLPESRFLDWPYNFVGIPLFAFGVYFALGTKRFFQRSDTPMAVDARPASLHTLGAFKFSRNPMYLGIAIALLGLAIFTANYFNLLFPLAFVVIMDRVFVPVEEENLTREFPDDYPAYKRKVRRWL